MTMLAKSPAAIKTSVDLYNGDRMTQKEFHRAYKKAPEGFKAELIGGIVYVASPLSLNHSEIHGYAAMTFGMYCAATHGVQFGDNATVVLARDSEPQPDLFLRIRPEFGGQSKTEAGYIRGAPELVAEIANTSHSLDLHGKNLDYQKHGVLEYLVVSIKENTIRWFDLAADKELSLDADGIYRVRRFPGLWIHCRALLSRDAELLIATLQRGLASPEHAEFVKKLAVRAGGKRR
jgi:Uma2 family endonuclease